MQGYGAVDEKASSNWPSINDFHSQTVLETPCDNSEFVDHALINEVPASSRVYQSCESEYRLWVPYVNIKWEWLVGNKLRWTHRIRFRSGDVLLSRRGEGMWVQLMDATGGAQIYTVVGKPTAETQLFLSPSLTVRPVQLGVVQLHGFRTEMRLPSLIAWSMRESRKIWSSWQVSSMSTSAFSPWWKAALSAVSSVVPSTISREDVKL